MTIVNDLDLDSLVLRSGAHRSISEGACLLEAVAYIAGEEWSDRPECVCPVLAAFGRSWNDALNDEDIEEEASALEALPALSSVELCRAAMPVIGNARVKALAAGDAARAAAWDAARAAAWDADWDALKPHVEMLQTSAVDLFERMLAVTV